MPRVRESSVDDADAAAAAALKCVDLLPLNGILATREDVREAHSEQRRGRHFRNRSDHRAPIQ